MSSLARIPLRIAQVSDLHFGGGLSLPAEAMDGLAEAVNAIEPDIAVIAGDLTTEGYEWEYEQAAAWLERIEAPQVLIPGNHDARNVGYLHYRRLFGDPYGRFRQAVRGRARRAAARDRLHGCQPRLVGARRERGPGRPRPLRVAPRAAGRARRHPDRHRPPPPRPDPGHRTRAEHRPRRRRPPAPARRARRRRRARRPQARAVLLGPERDAALQLRHRGDAPPARRHAAVVERAARRRRHDQGLHPLPRRPPRALGRSSAARRGR